MEADYLVLRPAFTARGIAEYLPSMVDFIERDLIHCFSGPVAEAIYRHRQSDRLFRSSGRADLVRGHELISLLPPRLLLDAESRAIARSSCLVHRYWFAVRAVADLLQEQGAIDEWYRHWVAATLHPLETRLGLGSQPPREETPEEYAARLTEVACAEQEDGDPGAREEPVVAMRL